MNTITKTMIASTLIFLMSTLAAADIETGWDYGKRNPLPDDPTYIRYDFETPSGSIGAHASVVNFAEFMSGYPLYPDKWGIATVGGRGYHIYPKDFFHNLDGSQVDYIYLVNGEHGAQPIFWRCTNVKCEYWPGNKGMLYFPNGASDISFLASVGQSLELRAYDKTGKLIGTSGIAYRNIGRVPPNPSNFTRVSFTTEKPIINSVSIHSKNNNFWVIDDLVIGGLTFPDKPTDYTYAAERMKQLIGAEYLEFGLGYDLFLEHLLTAEEIKDDNPDPYWNPRTKDLMFGNGIYDTNAIIWAFNVDEDHINWMPIDKMAKQDFTEKVAYEDIQPGDVFFIDYPENHADGTYGPDGYYDEVGIVIEPQYDPETGMTEDIIRIIPEAGVHYGSSEFINALYGSFGFVDYKRLPDNPKGGHSPYPKIPNKFEI